ncbi:hypothetical protein V490_06862 [Pseudogymnoascus sp. VKM F-3557]|nr:hypothetical protein V490_06862 [Pseudogymnoascus sp. VKM F-3557]
MLTGMELQLSEVVWTALFVWFCFGVSSVLYNVLFHPLRAYPGPLAARATIWWKIYTEVIKKESMSDVLFGLHRQFGDIVRIGPNELHFANPAAYHDIYNSSARWDKERMLYEGFGEDHSSFGMLTYAESRPRKEVLLPLFSRRAILSMQGLVREKIDHFASILAKNNANGNSSDLLLGFRCFTIDTITTFCFAQSVDAIDEPEFAAPIVEAMDNTLPAFHAFKYFPLLRKSILSIPPWLSLKISPQMAGLSRLQMLLGKQVTDVIANPDSLKDSPHPIIYSRLLDPDVQKGNPIPDATSLYEEAQSLVFAGGVTVADTLMTGYFQILSQPSLYTKLQAEVLGVWPDIDSPPKFEVLETLPTLTATIKESLRHSPGVSSSLLRIVPANGATISGRPIPGGTIVGMSSAIVHKAPSIFADPESFAPERWLEKGAVGLDKYLVSFSKGPRSCTGVNLAWCELYIAFATLLRRFDMELDGTTEADLAWRDCFTPYYPGKHMRAWCRPKNT